MYSVTLTSLKYSSTSVKEASISLVKNKYLVCTVLFSKYTGLRYVISETLCRILYFFATSHSTRLVSLSLFVPWIVYRRYFTCTLGLPYATCGIMSLVSDIADIDIRADISAWPVHHSWPHEGCEGCGEAPKFLSLVF